MEKQKDLTESMENYLEVILDLENKHKVARAKDIADKLMIQPGSVSGALKKLEEKGLINYAPYSYISLTEKGKKTARDIVHRHQVLKDFLLNVLQVRPNIAEETACRMEHVIDKTSLERMVHFIEYIHICPRAGEKWLASFRNYCKTLEHDKHKCELCIDELKTGHQDKP